MDRRINTNRAIHCRLFLIAAVLTFYTLNSNAQRSELHCAKVNYYNTNTKTKSQYQLVVETKDDQLIEIRMPNGGHLDDDDFGTVEFNWWDRAKAHVGNRSYDVKLLDISADHCFDGIPKHTRCLGRTKKGNRCKNVTNDKTGRCHWHR